MILCRTYIGFVSKMIHITYMGNPCVTYMVHIGDPINNESKVHWTLLSLLIGLGISTPWIQAQSDIWSGIFMVFNEYSIYFLNPGKFFKKSRISGIVI